MSLSTFPGVQYHNIPIDKVSQVTAAHIAQQSSHLEDDSAPQPEPKLELSEELAQLQQPITGVQLLVCCHGSRDVRCGNIGNSLVKSLHRLIHEQQLEDKIEVLKCSHVGGHKVKQLSQLCAAVSATFLVLHNCMPEACLT